MRLVIDDDDILHAHQVGHYTLEHLAFGLLRIQFFTPATLKELPPAFGKVDTLAKFESVVVCNDDLGSVHVFKHVAGNEFEAGVVAVGVIRLEDTQPVFDRQAGSAD
jgi:hypothetical protein